MKDTVMGILCPDCDEVCEIAFSCLVGNGRLVHLTRCGKCNDRQTIRVYVAVSPKVWGDAFARDLPVFNYKGRQP